MLFLVTNAVDDENELEAFSYCFLTICTGCSAACICFECYVVRLDVLIVQMLVSNLYEVYMMIFCYELHYIHIFLYCILSMRCELYDRVCCFTLP